MSGHLPTQSNGTTVLRGAREVSFRRHVRYVSTMSNPVRTQVPSAIRGISSGTSSGPTAYGLIGTASKGCQCQFENWGWYRESSKSVHDGEPN
jgi:hypothetical protein